MESPHQKVELPPCTPSPSDASLTTIPTPPEQILQPNHEIPRDVVHIQMLSQLPKVSYATAKVVLGRYSLHDILAGNTDPGILAKLTYDSNFRLGDRGVHLHGICEKLSRQGTGNTHTTEFKHCVKILSRVRGITTNCAATILQTVPLHDIASGESIPGCISDIKKQGGRRVGKAIEERIRMTFN